MQGHQTGLFSEWPLGTVSEPTDLKNVAVKHRVRCSGSVTGYWLWMLGLLLGKQSEGWAIGMHLPKCQ